MGFGSGVVVPGTGVGLAKIVASSSPTEDGPNQVGPSKRPFHTVVPGALMGKSEPLMAFGLMGGPIQAQAMFQMMMRTQVWGQDPQTAADAPRWRVCGPRSRA